MKTIIIQKKNNNDIILNEFLNNLNNYSTLYIIAIHQYLSKNYKDYHHQVVRALSQDKINFDHYANNAVIVLKSIFVDSCGVSFQENVNEFINVTVKLGQLICDILFDDQIFDKKKQVLCFEVLDLFNHVCDSSQTDIILDIRFIQMIKVIFTQFSTSKCVFKNERYNMQMLLKLLKKCHDLLNFHDDTFYSNIIICLLFHTEDVPRVCFSLPWDSGLTSHFVQTITEKCHESTTKDLSRKWLSFSRKLVLVSLDWLCGLVHDEDSMMWISNSLALLSHMILSLNKESSTAKGWILLFLCDDGELMKLLAYSLLIKQQCVDSCIVWDCFELTKTLFETVCYDVELVCQWMREYEDFRDVFTHFLKIFAIQHDRTETKEFVTFLRGVQLRWVHYATTPDDNVAIALTSFFNQIS